jgi:hypothetical protein
VEPDPFLRAQVGDRRHGVDRRGRCGANGGNDGHRDHASRAVVGDRLGQSIDLNREVPVRGNPANGLLAQTQQDHRLVDRRVRVLRAVETKLREIAPAAHSSRADVGRDVLARGRQRVQRRHRRGVVDHALERRRQAHQIAQPAERDFLELGRRRRGTPQHRLLVEPRAQHLGEDAGAAGAGVEVSKETRMVPVRQAGDDDALEVREDVVERFAMLRRARGQRASHVARRHARQDRIAFGLGEVIGEPVDDAVAFAAEGLRIHVARGARRVGHDTPVSYDAIPFRR